MKLGTLIRIAAEADPNKGLVNAKAKDDPLATDIVLRLSKAYNEEFLPHHQLDAAIATLREASDRLKAIIFGLEMEASRYADDAALEDEILRNSYH